MGRLVPLIALLALVAAPFGRLAAAEATSVAPAHHAMAGHCDDAPEPGSADADRAIDCLIACAAVACAAAPAMAASPAPAAAPTRLPLALFVGLHPEADPPPPRFS